MPTYEAMNEIPVARCGTVWTSLHTGNEYLLVSGQFLYFGMMLPQSLLNPNQIQAYDIEVNDNSFDKTDPIGVDCNNIYVPFDTKGTLVYFESRVLMDWEIKHLPRIHITGDRWNPMSDNVFPAGKSQEQREMQMIKSLMSGMTRRQVSAL